MPCRRFINGYRTLTPASAPAPRKVECWTRDAVVPAAEDIPIDEACNCIPIRPSLDEDWVIVDSSKDRKTGWARKRAR